MVAEVSSVVRMMNGYNKEDQMVNESNGVGGGKSTVLITRDLLGGCCTLDSKELDLDLQVPTGWEKRLDLKSGKVYLQRCNSQNPSSSSSSDHNHNQKTNQTVLPKLQDLNFPPSPKQALNLFHDTNLDLMLIPTSASSSSSITSSSSPNYQSVCTLDKVKSALERAEKESIRKRSISRPRSSSPSNSSSSIKETVMEVEESSNSSFAAGCPSCLLYVLISKNNPKCPRCNTIVPCSSMVAMKKPRIDLNISI